MQDLERLAHRLVAWLRARADDAGAVGAVVGISGGVDSATAAALCLRAFPDTTLGVLMPCHSDARHLDDAQAVCAALRLPCTLVVLDGVYDALVAALQTTAQFVDHRLALANLKPRLRMTTLYFFANSLNRLVVGTGNRSELAVGYFTKYGDGGVDVLPLGGLTKTEVRALARSLGIPEAVVHRTPTAGLWPGQTDEQEMGVTYAVLDRYLRTGEAPEDARQRIERLHAASEHKRRPPPIPDLRA
ncbi:MAG: NAD(+) synthase [Armatimonadota bacterium]|nr:NAD(+) synthase [Armatimonadota bacterium]MDR7536675.1 NAD(+) synthase [Armatimonadota bacterium]